MVAQKKQYCQEAMTADNSAVRKPHDNRISDFCTNASILTSKIRKDKDYASIMKYLDKLSLPQGFSLNIEECKESGLGDVSNLYVETNEGVYDYSIWDYLHVEDSIDGACQAYFLYKITHILPLWWHANYISRTYLYSDGDEKCIYFYALSEESTEEIRRIVKSYSVSPDAVEINGKYYVSCCYWSNFGGLIQETVEITISSEHKVSFKDIDSKTLYQYDCGIMF